MRSTLKFLAALAISLLVMLAFRTLVFTIYSVDGTGLEPTFKAGDRVVVNRWSYGLRTGGGGLFSYGRLCWQSPAKGEYVAFEDADGRMFVGRCTALPGDTVTIPGKGLAVMPSRKNCDRYDCYYLEHVGVVTEESIVGRVVMILYNHQAGAPFWNGYDGRRTFLQP